VVSSAGEGVVATLSWGAPPGAASAGDRSDGDGTGGDDAVPLIDVAAGSDEGAATLSLSVRNSGSAVAGC
jgi:hypothetical protein